MSNDNTLTGVSGRVVSGAEGGLGVMSRIQTWSIDPSVGDNAWGDSNCDGYTARKAGRKDLTGTVTGKYDSSDKIWLEVREGDSVDIALFTEAGTYWYVPAIILAGPSFGIDVDTEDVVGWSFDFGSRSKFWLPGEAGAPAASIGGIT